MTENLYSLDIKATAIAKLQGFSYRLVLTKEEVEELMKDLQSLKSTK